MNTTRTLRNAAALAVTVFAALSAHAGDPGQDTYRRIVLGDTTVAAPQAAEATQLVVPGSYARYLIKNGMPTSQAIDTARATGETPTVESVERTATDNLTGLQRYVRAMGISING